MYYLIWQDTRGFYLLKIMQNKILSCDDPDAIRTALDYLNSGKIIAFPTDTLYGVATKISNTDGILRLYTIKGRNSSKAIAVLIGDISHLPLVALEVNDDARHLVERFWPGALTLIFPRRPDTPTVLSPLPTIGVRMPNYPFTLSLLQQSGPLATTSANLSGSPDPLTAEDVISQLGERIDLILDGGKTPGTTGSTVVDCTTHPPSILRQGLITVDEIYNTLRIEQ